MHRPSPAAGTTAVPMDGELTLRLLGEPALERIADDGARQRVLGLGKPLALLAYLAVVPQHEASREFLADLLWGDDSVSDPLHSLRNAILLIAKQVDATLLDATTTRCRLARILPTDITGLTQALGNHDLERAMALYTGEFLPNFAAPGCREFEHWCESIRLRVRTDVVNAADVLVRQLLDGGRPRDAEHHARRMIEIDPHNQRGRRILLEALLAGGDRMAAITEAALTEQWLEAESIEPDSATTALMQQARRTRPSLRTTGEHQAVATTQALDASSDLIGRAAEFAAIMKAWEAARAGTTSLVSVVAGAGLGKTRLLSDIDNRLRAQRAQVVSVRALADEREVPFSLVAALAGELARLPGAAGVSPATGGILVGLDASLASVFHAPADFAGTDQVLRRARALHDLLGCVAEERPVVLLLDDLHWGDDASLAVIPAMLARLANSRVLAVIATRPGRGTVLTSDRTVQLSLAPLSMEQIGQLIASIRPLPSLAWTGALVLGVFAASHGVPVFALLALRDATARGLVRIGESLWECDQPDALATELHDGAALPSALRDLPPRAHRVLLALAVAGRGVPMILLTEALAPGVTGALTESLTVLERRGLIHRSGDVVSPTHDVVAESALAGVLPDVRRDTTRTMALAMLGADDVRWHERGVRLLSTVATADELASRLASLLEDAPVVSGIGVALALQSWLGDSPEQARLAREVARRLPLHLRVRPFRRHIAIGSLAAGLLVAASAWTTMHPPTAVDATLLGFNLNGETVTETMAVPLTASGWDATTAIDGQRDRSATRMTSIHGGYLGARQLLSSGEILFEHTYSDSGGSDIDVMDAAGRSTRLTSAPGDDVPEAWSPDGRLILFESSRWSPLRHHQIGILDRSTGAVRRLTHSDGRDAAGIWSPDGSRIAFTRSFLDERLTQTCVIGMNGVGERCVPGTAQLLGWRTPNEILASYGAYLLIIRPAQAWTADTVSSSAFNPMMSANGRWLAWWSGSGAIGTVSVAPATDPTEVRRVRWPTTGPAPRLIAWGPFGARPPYLDQLSINIPTDTVMVGVPHRVAVSARWSDGSQTPPPYLQWRVGSPSDGTIDSTGTLVARRTGVITVVASAGGWRATSARVVAVAATARLASAVDWTSGLKGWRGFGDPIPTVTRDPRLGSALLNNGDGTYFSGAYRQDALRWNGGLAVDAVVSTPVTELQWQTLVLDLRPSQDGRALAAWDHTTGFMPSTGNGGACVFSYPGGEGLEGLATMLPLPGPIPGSTRTPLRLANGQPYRVRLQLLPDGRCGVAINGAPVWMSLEQLDARLPVRLVTYGNSWKTRMLLGPLTIWQGVPDDIDWSRLSMEIPVNMPPAPTQRTTPRSPK